MRQKLLILLCILLVVFLTTMVVTIFSGEYPRSNKPEISNEVLSRKLCDLDNDGDCDYDDYKIYLRAERTCIDGRGAIDLPQYGFKREYNPLADANGDGCVLADDRELLFPVIPER